ncbi:RNA chaperone Hfq [Tenuibacillus multivorans]|nr:RNA chaperone Hfq [Tenuibacillus multivorans]
MLYLVDSAGARITDQIERKEKVPLTVFLTNGFQLRGVLKSFDNFTILIETEGRQQLIFKHAISTFAPSKNIDLES